ncbi:MAG TPA: hypothetical protein VFW07_15255 [Parafilimonas sp.]|nr:hypothetical protein [Parafilimonas sp.]
MNIVTLFDNKIRTLKGPAAYNANPYNYYNDSDRPEIGNVRLLLEKWFSQYPDQEREELKSRFKVSLDPTFYELYVYMLFKSLGYSLTIHPKVPGTQRRPDYLATKDQEILYIEVKHMTMLSQDEQSLERRKNTLLDSLNKVNASKFLLKLDAIIFKDSSQPSGKAIIRFFNEALAVHDPDIYADLLARHGFQAMPKIVYDDDKVTIEVQLLPKSPLHRGTNSRSIAVHPAVTQIGNNSENIIDSLLTKATRYGNFNAPYIICLNKQSVSLDIIEIQEALYGSLKVSWSEDPMNRDEKLGLSGNGFFGSKDNPKSTRVSGVYITNANTANLGTTAEHAFRHNPFAQFPINLTINQSIVELLNIPRNYS